MDRKEIERRGVADGGRTKIVNQHHQKKTEELDWTCPKRRNIAQNSHWRNYIRKKNKRKTKEDATGLDDETRFTTSQDLCRSQRGGKTQRGMETMEP